MLYLLLTPNSHFLLSSCPRSGLFSPLSPVCFLSPLPLSLFLTDMHQPFAAHYVNSPGPGCQLLMSPLGLFNLGISAGWDEGEPHDLSPQPHEEAQAQGRGRACSGQGRAGQGRVGPRCLGCGWTQTPGAADLWSVTRTNLGALRCNGCPYWCHVSESVISGGVLGAFCSLLDCHAILRTRDSMSVTCKHCCYPLSS